MPLSDQGFFDWPFVPGYEYISAETFTPGWHLVSVQDVVLPHNLTCNKAHPLYPMTKKRRSLQSIAIPSFLQSPPFTHRKSPSRARSYSYGVSEPQPSSSAMNDDQSPFLLDDDPFANLTSSAVVASIDKIFSPSASRPTSPTPVPTVAAPRSPLSPPHSVQSSYFGAVSPHVPAPLCPRGRIKPAYERLAFSSRPSLPSLDTLAHMSLAPPQKV